MTAQCPTQVSTYTVRRRPTRWLVALVSLLLAGAAGFAIFRTTDMLAPGPADSYSGPSAASTPGTWIDWPKDAEAAAAVVNGHVLTGPGSSQPRPIASLSKVITALVILEDYPLVPGDDGEQVPISHRDVEKTSSTMVQGGSWMPLIAGQTMSVRQLLEGGLVASANNYMEVLSTWAYGNDKEFSARVERWAEQHGLDTVSLVEPTGLSSDNVASAEDLARIGTLALDNDMLSHIVAMTSVEGTDGTVRANTNQLLRLDGSRGIKTGYTDAAGYCLLFAATGSGDAPIVTVVLGTSSVEARDTATEELLSQLRHAEGPDSFIDVPTAGYTKIGALDRSP